MKSFSAEIFIIGVNPYVLLPEPVLTHIFKQAGKDKGAIQVKGTLNGHPFLQNLVKYSGAWRLYLNGVMRTAAGIDVGDTAHVKIEFDPEPRIVAMHPKLEKALDDNKDANTIFRSLAPSLQKEIVRYIANLKSEEAVDRNIVKAIDFLLGKEGRWIGRERVL